MRIFVAVSAMVAGLISISGTVAAPPSAAEVSSFAELKQLAQQTAKAEFVPRAEPPAALAAMDYDQYRQIEFRSDQAVWWDDGLPFWLETFHRGFVQRDRVQLFTVDSKGTNEVPFSVDNFRYGLPIENTEGLDDAGHAGIKIVGRFPGRSDGQEMLTFLGSSYFRGRSAETLYGTSARGLAVNIALNRDEEFPFFRSFWVQRPKPGDEKLTILALMDSPSVAGAYRFRLTPGTTETQVDVQCALYFRSVPEKIGIAPLTSMWIWGDGLPGPAKDLRPGVHDSDGLLIDAADQGWTWHAFARQSYPSVSRFPVTELRGFGLLQRNRAFYHYDDHNAQYHKRPSVWIKPRGQWQDGVIELLELPGAHEGIDNIAAFWIPRDPPSIDQPVELDYQVQFFPGDHASQAKCGRATTFDVERSDDSIELTIRFSGPAVAEMDRGTVQVAVQTIRGEVLKTSAKPTETKDWIATVSFRPTEKAPTELKVTLMDEDRKITETFSYLCPHEDPTFMYPHVYTRQE